MPPSATPEVYQDLRTSVYALNIKNGAAIFIKYADPIVTQMENLLDRREDLLKILDKTKLRDAPFYEPTELRFQTARNGTQFAPYFSDASNRQAYSSATGEYLTPSQTRLAKRQVEILKGIELAGLIDDPLVATDHLTRPQVKAFRKTIDNWKETEKNYAFASPTA